MTMDNLSSSENTTIDWIPEEEEFSRPISELIPLIAPLFIVPFVLCGNSVVLYAISKFKSLHKVTYYLLANLAIADILLAFGLIIRCLFNLANKLDKYSCILSNFIAAVSGGGSLSGTLIVCLHTHFGVRFPDRFHSGFTVKVAAALVIGAWSLWTIFPLIGVLTGNPEFETFKESCYLLSGYFSHRFVTAFCILVQAQLLILVFFQVSTVILVNRQEASFRALASQGNPSAAVSLNRLKKNASIVGIVTLILIFALIAWVPITISALILMYCPTCNITAEQVGMMAGFNVPYMVSNVIIYFVKSKEFNKLLPKVCKRQQVHPQ